MNLAWMYARAHSCTEQWVDIPFTHGHFFVEPGFCMRCGKLYREYFEELYFRFNVKVNDEIKNREEKFKKELSK